MKESDFISETQKRLANLMVSDPNVLLGAICPISGINVQVNESVKVLPRIGFTE